MAVSYSAACADAVRGRKSSGKWLSALITGYGVKPPSAQSEPNFIVLQRSVEQREVLVRLDPRRRDLVDHLDAARRADAAGRALAAAFDGAELHGEARLLQPCRRCRRTRRCRHGRSARPWRRRPRSRTACRTARAGNRRRAGRRPARPCTGRPVAVPPPMSSTSSPSVRPKAVSNRPPCLTLPASWIGMVPRERPMPKSGRRRRPWP